MKAADANRQLGLAKGAGQIQGARKLIGLDADQGNEAAAPFLLYPLNDMVRADSTVGLIKGVEAQRNRRAQDLPSSGVFRQTVQTGQGIGRQGRSQPLNGIAIVVVVRRFDHDEVKDVLIAG